MIGVCRRQESELGTQPVRRRRLGAKTTLALLLARYINSTTPTHSLPTRLFLPLLRRLAMSLPRVPPQKLPQLLVLLLDLLPAKAKQKRHHSVMLHRGKKIQRTERLTSSRSARTTRHRHLGASHSPPPPPSFAPPEGRGTRAAQRQSSRQDPRIGHSGRRRRA